MWYVIGLAVLATSLAADLPTPKAKHLHDGSLELTLEELAGIVYKDITYVHGGKKHRGPFFQSADGKWYHRNNNVNKHSHDKPIRYKLVAEKAGKHIAVNGAAWLVNTGLAIVPPKPIRAGTPVLIDNFDFFNADNWKHEVSMYGGYNWEIQVYTNDQLNVFTRDGKLFIKPTYTSDKFGESFLTTGIMDMHEKWGECTNSDRYGCHREGQYGLLPPIMSGKITSKKDITYGKVEVRAKIPRGDWIWPAIWMLPRNNAYGSWPKSGEIDIMESRGNEFARDGNGVDHGVREVSSTMHWGTDGGNNRYSMTHGDKRSGSRWSDDFHTYTLDWTADHIIVSVDGQPVLTRPTPNEGYFRWGNLPGNDIWGGKRSAPFDQAFYLILNVAVGGTNGFFPDSWSYNSPKPYNNNSPTEDADFWNNRHNWQSSWTDDVAMQVDWVKMWQL